MSVGVTNIYQPILWSVLNTGAWHLALTYILIVMSRCKACYSVRFCCVDLCLCVCVNLSVKCIGGIGPGFIRPTVGRDFEAVPNKRPPRPTADAPVVNFKQSSSRD